MLPEIKVWKVDFEFIVSNYLDRSLWSKVWNLFTYKEHVFHINLYRIETNDNEIVFEIRKNGYWDSELIGYNIENTPIKVLMKQINGAIFRLIASYERNLIKKTDGYKNIESARIVEEDKLRNIASNFLNNNGVTNEDIRDVYIDNYVKNNAKNDIRLQNYLDYYRYNYCTDMFITFCKATKDEDRLQMVKDSFRNTDNLIKIEAKVDEYMKELESGERDNELYNELEGL